MIGSIRGTEDQLLLDGLYKYAEELKIQAFYTRRYLIIESRSILCELTFQ
jgi:hypothetical protein